MTTYRKLNLLLHKNLILSANIHLFIHSLCDFHPHPPVQLPILVLCHYKASSHDLPKPNPRSISIIPKRKKKSPFFLLFHFFCFFRSSPSIEPPRLNRYDSLHSLSSPPVELLGILHADRSIDDIATALTLLISYSRILAFYLSSVVYKLDK